MTDIVEALEDALGDLGDNLTGAALVGLRAALPLAREQAAELARLRAENERLRDIAVQAVKRMGYWYNGYHYAYGAAEMLLDEYKDINGRDGLWDDVEDVFHSVAPPVPNQKNDALAQSLAALNPTEVT